MKGLSILVVDDEEVIRREVKEFLSAYGYTVFEAAAPSEAFALLMRERIDVMLLDVKLPEMDGIAVLARIRAEWPEIEVIMMSGHGDMDTTIAALRGGAFDFFKKPLDGLEVRNSIERTKRYLALTGRIRTLEQTYASLSDDIIKNVGSIIGQSTAIRGVIDMTLRAAGSDDTPVLITGESGSGKELIARVIHFASARKESAFYAVNCPSIPDTLIESEMFGCIKGAFTGADTARAGCFETANGGTLFLDEIGDMPLEAQAKMLRVIEEKKIRRIGGNHETPVNVRVVCATNKPPKTLIPMGKFREDLYYRLSTVEIHIPPLRERTEDIPLLVEHYAAHFTAKLNRDALALDPSAMRMLSGYPFPGNIRELKNMIERAVILCDGNTLTPDHFPLGTAERISPAATLELESLERSAISEALKRTSYNKTKASELLGITIFALSRKMEKHRIEIEKKI